MVETSPYIVPWGLGQGFASCVPAFIDNNKLVNGESMSSAVSYADKQFMERRNVFFRAWFVKVQRQKWCHGSHEMYGAKTRLPCLQDTLAVVGLLQIGAGAQGDDD